VRLFIAIALPPEVAAAAAAVLPDIPGLRRVRPEQLHLTLAFLGDTPDERLADVLAATAEAGRGKSSFAITLDAAGRFPASGVPRIVWLGMGEGATESSNLAAAVRRALAARELPFDDKPFRAHVTLARVKPEVDRASARAIAAAVDRLRVPALRFGVQALIPFESALSPKGPRYTPRGAIALA
jgi:2'-5' RNA ligase